MKTAFNLIALIAVVNLLILGGLTGYLIFSGRLTGESAAAIAAVLRGEKWVPAAATPTSATTTTSKPAATDGRTDGGNPLDVMEMQTALLDRQRRALEVDRYARLNDAQLKLIRDREAFARERESFRQQMKVEQQTTQDEGFNKALTLYTQLPPKVVKDHFMKADTEVVVRYLMQMPKRNAANILKEFKTPAERQKGLEIMDRIRTRQVLADPTSRSAGG